jgi:hypothetical protein
VSSPKLWTTFNTLDKRAHTFITGGRSRRPISLFMFRLYLKRSNYALHTAVISGKDSFDGTKMELLTRLCKDLRHLELHGFHLMVDSLVNALPFAQNLRTLIVSNRTTAKTMLKALQLCSQTLVKAAFLSLDGTLDTTQAWPMLESMECLDIRNGPTPMWADLVCPDPPLRKQGSLCFASELTQRIECPTSVRTERQGTDPGGLRQR